MSREQDMAVLYELVRALITEVLRNQPESLNQEELYNYVHHNFRNVKHDIQTSISMAFTDAISDVLQEYSDYYCEIKPIPAPINKLEC